MPFKARNPVIMPHRVFAGPAGWHKSNLNQALVSFALVLQNLHMFIVVIICCLGFLCCQKIIK